jgi:signal transduction histidine kinase
MRERAALVGAALEIESSPGAGTTIFVRMIVEATGDHHSDHA